MSSIKDINELRSYLADELQKVSNGDTTPAAANASANLAGKIIGSIKMELEYNKMTGTTPMIDFIKTHNKKLKEIESVSKETGEIEFKKDDDANTK